MEKGILNIRKTRKGFAAEIRFERLNGKDGFATYFVYEI